MDTSEKREYLLRMIKDETVPAVGCTEPVAVAYAAAVANKYMSTEVKKIDVMTSKNIFKNGKSVIIPGTKEWGLDLAAVLGSIIGDPDGGLMVLKDVDDKSVELAHKWIEEKEIKVGYLDKSPNVYVEVCLSSDSEEVKAVLKDDHDNIDRVYLNGEIVYQNDEGKNSSNDKNYYNTLKEMTFVEIREIIESYNVDEIRFIQDGIDINKAAAKRGLSEDSGLNIGRTLFNLQRKGLLGDDEPTNARIFTSAGSDVRMGGGLCPIMTSGGSGNQGLGVIIPISTVAEARDISDEKLYKAIFFGHVLNKYIKLYTGKLSAMCGCAIAAGVGSAAGITWMLGGNDRQIGGACENLLSNLAGMICDGAKDNCAIKLATSAYESVIAAFLALEGVIVNKNIGIVGENVEDTIKNLGILAIEGFAETNNVIVNLYSNCNVMTG